MIISNLSTFQQYMTPNCNRSHTIDIHRLQDASLDYGNLSIIIVIQYGMTGNLLISSSYTKLKSSRWF